MINKIKRTKYMRKSVLLKLQGSLPYLIKMFKATLKEHKKDPHNLSMKNMVHRSFSLYVHLSFFLDRVENDHYILTKKELREIAFSKKTQAVLLNNQKS